jgi:hypothetical protein
MGNGQWVKKQVMGNGKWAMGKSGTTANIVIRCDAIALCSPENRRAVADEKGDFGEDWASRADI